MLRAAIAALIPAGLVRHRQYTQPAAGFVAYQTVPFLGVIAFIAADGERVTRW
jgi:hypothetical protein